MKSQSNNICAAFMSFKSMVYTVPRWQICNIAFRHRAVCSVWSGLLSTFAVEMGERKILMGELRHLIQCKLCNGALVDATTIIECLHTFCKSCIVKYLKGAADCPICHNEVHQSEALRLNCISHDRTFQDVVNAVLPDLKKAEAERERSFYLEHPRIANPKLSAERTDSDVVIPRPAALSSSASEYHRTDEQISVQLECKSNVLLPLKRRYLRCSKLSSVLHLKKFIAAQLFNDISRCNEVVILCNDEIQGKDHTLMFIALTRWRFRDPPLVLTYREYLEIL